MAISIILHLFGREKKTNHDNMFLLQQDGVTRRGGFPLGVHHGLVLFFFQVVDGARHVERWWEEW